MAKVVEVRQPVNLDKLHDEILAAVPVARGRAFTDREGLPAILRQLKPATAVMFVTGSAEHARIELPDDVPDDVVTTVETVCKAHRPSPATGR